MMDKRRFGWLILGSLLGLLLCWWWWWRCSAVTTFLVVRHADRAGTADALTTAGLVRAQELVHVAERAGVDAVYQTDTQRSRLTAAPVAAALGLIPLEFPEADPAAPVTHAWANHLGGTVLIVSHSDKVDDVIQEAGGPDLPDLSSAEFDNFFVVDVCRCRWGPARVTNLQYGAVSP